MEEIKQTEDANRILVTFHKKADKTLHKVTIPKIFRQLNGDEYYMDVYRDKIIITPFKKKREE